MYMYMDIHILGCLHIWWPNAFQ